jgi:hypothetical protein
MDMLSFDAASGTIGGGLTHDIALTGDLPCEALHRASDLVDLTAQSHARVNTRPCSSTVAQSNLKTTTPATRSGPLRPGAGWEWRRTGEARLRIVGDVRGDHEDAHVRARIAPVGDRHVVECFLDQHRESSGSVRSEGDEPRPDCGTDAKQCRALSSSASFHPLA